MDGVLFDTERMYQQTWRELAEERGIKLGDGFTKAISGTSGSGMARVLEEWYQVKDGAEIARECMERMEKKLSIHVPVKEGVREILGFFQERGVLLAVASSSSVEQIEANLRGSGIREYFTAVTSGSEVERGKPAPDIFLRAAEKIGCRPEECFVFEDSVNGVRAGIRAGCATIMVPDLIEAPPEIRPGCLAVCSSLSEALQVCR